MAIEQQMYLAISMAAAVAMGYAVYSAFQLKKSLIGGEVGEKVSLLAYFLLFFFTGYIVMPVLLTMNPALMQYVLVIAGFVFLMGALFCIIVVRLVSAIASLFEMTKK